MAKNKRPLTPDTQPRGAATKNADDIARKEERRAVTNTEPALEEKGDGVVGKQKKRLVGALQPRTAGAVTQALNAGVPFSTIFEWLLAHGADLWKVIQQLIDLFKKNPTPPPVTPPAPPGPTPPIIVS